MKPKPRKEEENLHEKTDNILLNIQKQLKLSEDALKPSKCRRSMSIACAPHKLNLNQNIVKIKDSSLEFVNIDDDFKNKPKDSPFDDICSICSSNIYTEKYLCLICKECILCTNCELNHLHPVIKWKNNQLSNLNKIYLFMSNYNKEIIDYRNKNKGGIFGSNKPKYYFRLESNELEYSMKPNQNSNISITIYNLNNTDVDCQQLKLVLLGRNIKDLIVYNKEIKDKIMKGQGIQTSISIESGNFSKMYHFDVGIFSSADIELEFNTITYKVKVSN